MARLARIVVPGLPHPLTQRGNRREALFFEDGDHEIYIDLLAEQALKVSMDDHERYRVQFQLRRIKERATRSVERLLAEGG